MLASALSAEAAEGCPLDLEWAVDAQDEIHWLQARPITHLPPDPNELDTPITDPTHIYTRCNVGEMFPGACTPLSYSFTARSIDVGMQMMHVQVGIQDAVLPSMRFLIMNSGHLFLNLSTMSETATHALGSSADQMALSVCGRPITEFTIRGSARPPRLRRIANGLRYLGYLFSRPRARREMRRLVSEPRFGESDTAAAAWQEIDRRFQTIYDAMHYHLISSASSGVLTPQEGPDTPRWGTLVRSLPIGGGEKGASFPYPPAGAGRFHAGAGHRRRPFAGRDRRLAKGVVGRPGDTRFDQFRPQPLS